MEHNHIFFNALTICRALSRSILLLRSITPNAVDSTPVSGTQGVKQLMLLLKIGEGK